MKSIKKSVNTIIFAGLLVSLLPATPFVRGQESPPIVQQITSTLRAPRLSAEEIDYRIRLIKELMKNFAAAKAVVPLLVFGTKATIVALIGGAKGLELVTSLAAMVAMTAFVSAPMAMFLSAIGLSGISLLTAVEVLGELERVAKDYPGALTWEQKRVLDQLKNMIKEPIVRGIIEYFTLNNILRMVVDTAMEKSLLLGIVALGQPHTIYKIVAKYIKLKWMERNAKSGIVQMAKTMIPAEQKDYKKAVKELRKIEQQIQDLEKAHVYLAKDLEVQRAVQKFQETADRILEGLKRQALEKERPQPIREAERPEQVVVPL